MIRSHRLFSLALAFAFTLTMLAGIDHLAQRDTASAQLAQAAAQQG